MNLSLHASRASSFAMGALLSVMLALGGCASLRPQIETPRLAIVHVAMTSGDIFSQQFLVRMHVQNPNDRELTIRGLDYQLFLEGDSFAEGVSNESFVLPPLGETEFEMTVRTNFVSGIGRLLSRLGDRSQVNYVVEGKVFTDIAFLKRIPFRESGSVDLSKL